MSLRSEGSQEGKAQVGARMLRPLVIDEEVKALVGEVVSFAEGNHYYPGKSEIIPGDDPRHTVQLLSYRCVFSVTHFPSEPLPMRHLSVSIPGTRYPHPLVFCAIAELFGFTGWDGKSERPPAEWLVVIQKEDHCITAVQAV